MTNLIVCLLALLFFPSGPAVTRQIGLLRLIGVSSPAGSFSYSYTGADRKPAAISLPGSLQMANVYTWADPYGNLIRKGGVLADENTMRFSSKEFHARSGLYYYGFRYYDANLQQWLNQDPIGEAGGINLYGFVHNNPINNMDPLGLAHSYISETWTEGIPGSYPYVRTDGWGNDRWFDYALGPAVNMVSTVGNAMEQFSEFGGWLLGTLEEKITGRRELGEEFGRVAVWFLLPEGRGAGLGRRPCPASVAETAPKIKPGSIADKPPGWNQNWEWHSSPRAKSGSDGWRWRDPQGGEWRRHVPDKHHPEAHWDYNPNSQWNSPWYNIDNNGNLLLFTSP